MPRTLPSTPSLEHLKKQAKDLQNAHRSQDPQVLNTLCLLHRFADASPEEIFSSRLALNEAQLALALDYGFASWGELKQHVLKRVESGFLHLHCGDSSANALRDSTVPGDVRVWHEIYVEGPVPDLPDDEFCEVRAAFLSEAMKMDYDALLQGAKARYRMLQEAGEYQEVVLWFDACMFDQTTMIHLIDLCAKQNWPDTKLSLICIGEFPGFDRFTGLGELSPQQLASLLDTRKEIDSMQIDLAQRSWRAFCSADPRQIEDLLREDCSALPYLSGALYRHLEQFPSAQNGLSRSERQVLQAVADGAGKLGQIFFHATSIAEERPFMGDSSLWALIDQLATCTTPLLQVAGPSRLRDALGPGDIDQPAIPDIKRWNVILTSAGKQVLSNQLDHVGLNGIDRWLGGVHLHDGTATWRWDSSTQALIWA